MNLDDYINEKEIQDGLEDLFESAKIEEGKIRLHGKDAILDYLKKPEIIEDSPVIDEVIDPPEVSEIVSDIEDTTIPVVETEEDEIENNIEPDVSVVNYDKLMDDYVDTVEPEPIKNSPTQVTLLGGGENNSIVNIGGGVPIYSDKYGSELRLRTLVSTGSISVVQVGDTIVLSGTDVVNNLTIKTTDYNTTTNDSMIIVSAGSNNVTINMVAATGSKRIYKIKSVGTGNITISANGSDTIDDESYQPIGQWDCINIVDYTTGKWAII